MKIWSFFIDLINSNKWPPLMMRPARSWFLLYTTTRRRVHVRSPWRRATSSLCSTAPTRWLIGHATCVISMPVWIQMSAWTYVSNIYVYICICMCILFSGLVESGSERQAGLCSCSVREEVGPNSIFLSRESAKRTGQHRSATGADWQSVRIILPLVFIQMIEGRLLTLSNVHSGCQCLKSLRSERN